MSQGVPRQDSYHGKIPCSSATAESRRPMNKHLECPTSKTGPLATINISLAQHRLWGHTCRTPSSTDGAVASVRGSADSAVKPDRSTPTQVQPFYPGSLPMPLTTTEPVGHIFQNLFLHSLHSSMLPSPISPPSPPTSHLNSVVTSQLTTSPLTRSAVHRHQEVCIPSKPASIHHGCVL